MKVVFSKRVLEYKMGGHPEGPERVSLIYEELKKDKRFEFVTASPANEKDLLLVHEKSLVEAVRENTFLDPDNPNIPNIFCYASLAVGSAILASQIALKEGVGFSLARPPGHHATKTGVGGFCYFNNIAVACQKLLREGKRVAILDIDVHHGNGTQEIFIGKKNIIFCSLHEVPLYPGTGERLEKNCYNFPLAAGADFKQYNKVLSEAVKKIFDFTPDVLGVSLGFDTYKLDPLANINLEIEDYYKIGKIIKKLAVPTFFVLEGGYSQDIGKCAKEFFKGFMEGN